jgi:probable HAF family extracellular repeat protein
MWSAGSGTTWLDAVPGDTYSAALGINNQGQVVGYSATTNGHPNHAFIYSGGIMNPIPLPFARYANDINNSGIVVGASYTTVPVEPVRTGFVWDPNSGLKTIVPPFGQSSETLAINDSGLVVGWGGYYLGPADPWQHAILYNGSNTTDIDTMGNNLSCADAINNLGQVVGFYRSSDNSINQGFLWQNGKMYDLRDLLPNGSGWDSLVPYDINEHGDIVGYGRYNGSDFTAFILTPVPEPITLPVATTGLTVQQAFNNAIGTGTVTGLVAGDDIFFSLYDSTNSRMLVGLVDAGVADTVITTGDVVTLVGTVTMTAADYAAFNQNNLSIIA